MTGADPLPQDWNADKAWSEMDVCDLRNHIAEGASLAETANFLMRREDEVAAKMRELGLPPAPTGSG